MTFINVSRANGASWVNAQAGGMGKANTASGTFKNVLRGWRVNGAAWEEVFDASVPSAAPGGTSITLVETPSNSHAVAQWTAITDADDVRYGYNVRVEWYRNGTLTVTDIVAQTVHLDSSPTSSTWSTGDVVKCVLRYVTVSDVTGPTWTSGNVTLTAGTGGGT